MFREAVVNVKSGWLWPLLAAGGKVVTVCRNFVNQEGLRWGRKPYLGIIAGQRMVGHCLLEVLCFFLFVSTRWLLILLHHVERRGSFPGAVRRVVVGIHLQSELLAEKVAVRTKSWLACPR